MKQNGRKSCRENLKKEKNVQNMNDDTNNRGMSWSTKIGIASLEMKSKDLNQQKKELKMLTYNCSINALQQNLVRAELRANQHCPVYDSKNELWMNVMELENRLKHLEEKLVMCGETSPESIKSSSGNSSKRLMISSLLIFNDENDTPAKKNVVSKIDENNTSILKEINDNCSEISSISVS